MPGPAAAAEQQGVKQGNLTKEEALRQAASSGDVAQVHELLASAADPAAADVEGWTALHWACGQAEVATYCWMLARLWMPGIATARPLCTGEAHSTA
jgi:ankyrin repeat protein